MTVMAVVMTVMMVVVVVVVDHADAGHALFFPTTTPLSLNQSLNQPIKKQWQPT